MQNTQNKGRMFRGTGGKRYTWCRVALWSCLLGACARPEPPKELLPMGMRLAPVDRVERGELAEGDTRVFGFKLPRDMTIESRLPKTVYAGGSVAFVALSNYVRQRVKAAKVATGPSKTVFEEAVVLRDKKHTLYVEVSKAESGRVELVVRDRSRKMAPQGLTEEQRWRKAGMNMKGEVIDRRANE
jgi:hypothetical protein